MLKLGKVHLELRFEECLNEDGVTRKLAVRVVECSDLPVTNGACNPYAVVTMCYGNSKYKEETKRTVVRKKTICPHYDETFFFDLEHRGNNFDRKHYDIEDIFSGALRVSLWHDDSRMAREVLGRILPGVFLGQIDIPLRDASSPQNSWYFLRPVLDTKYSSTDIGAIRLKISYNTEHVFSSQHYDDLRNLFLKSSNTVPNSSSAACILARVVDNLQDAAQPLVRVFLHHGKLVPFIETFANYEITHTIDHPTLFRGNTLLTKTVDELMKLVGLPYLHHILKPIISQICTEHLSCEIDPTRLQDSENINTNLDNLRHYIDQIFDAITDSGLICPTEMSQAFFTLRQVACKHYPDNNEIHYQVVSGFVFLRFFAPAILGPRFFELTEDTPDTQTNRTLTLISKAIQGLGNLVCSKSWSFSMKEDYMIPLFTQLSDTSHINAIKMFLDIISSSTKAHSSYIGTREVPVVLKQGMLIKRAQGRKKFGVKNFKRRYFCLTNESLTYSKRKDGIPLCVIPVEDILAVEQLQEESFKMKYMFQVIQPERALYVQANNCIEEKEWLDVLMRVSAANQNRLKMYHPAAYINNHWLCCKEVDCSIEGCSQVSSDHPLVKVQVDIDSDREIEKIHALLLHNMEKLEAMQDACGALEVYSGNQFSVPMEIEDSKSCFEMLNDLLKCVIGLEQEHKQYLKSVQKQHVKGSFERPIGDDSILSSSDIATKL
ncbi:Ras GTPase-activating protein 2 [Mactra antiquata]